MTEENIENTNNIIENAEFIAENIENTKNIDLNIELNTDQNVGETQVITPATIIKKTIQNRRTVRKNPKSTSAKNTTSTKKSRSKTVTVKSGDSLGRIASRNGTTVAKLRRLNGIKGDMIRPGQKIRVR